MKLTGAEIKSLASKLYDDDTYVVFMYDRDDANTSLKAITNDFDESLDSNEWALIVKEMDKYGIELEGVFEKIIEKKVERDY